VYSGGGIKSLISGTSKPLVMKLDKFTNNVLWIDSVESSDAEFSQSNQYIELMHVNV
jgi:hypothetical protein